jgi:colanic acid/amylovoran biosynthesis protein
MNILVTTNHSSLNAGDRAILTETLRMLDGAFPGARVTLLFNDVVSGRASWPDYTVLPSPLAWAFRLDPAQGYRLVEPLLQLLRIGALLLGVLLHRWTGWHPRLFADRERQALLDAAMAADLVLVVGGGHIYGPAAYPNLRGRMWFMLWFLCTLLGGILAIAGGKPLALLPQSIGPLHGAFQRGMVGWVVRRAGLTFVRERPSLDLLHDLGAAGRALLVPDFVFGFAGADRAAVVPILARLDAVDPPAALRVGMTAMNWAGQSGDGFAGQRNYERALLGCVDAITAQNGVVVLFGQCCGPTPAEDDRLISAALRARASQPERVIVVDEVLPPAQLQAAYGAMDYLVGTRTHSVILALNAGTPALCVGYLHKTAGILAQMGLERYCYDIDRLTPEHLVAAFEQLRAAPEQSAVAAYLGRARRSKQAIGALLQLLVASRRGE